MAENLITATDQDFQEVISGDTPVLVDFWAEWCAPCRIVAPVVEKLASDYSGSLKVAKLNVDENPQTAMSYDVMSIPTLILYKDGIEKKRLVGARPEHALVAELSEFISPA
jgi:thioredoxin 1